MRLSTEAEELFDDGMMGNSDRQSKLGEARSNKFVKRLELGAHNLSKSKVKVRPGIEPGSSQLRGDVLTTRLSNHIVHISDLTCVDYDFQHVLVGETCVFRLLQGYCLQPLRNELHLRTGCVLEGR